MARKKLTQRNAKQVLDKVLAMPAADRKVVLEAWTTALDDLRSEDFFGTEGQNDPRGDGRED